MTGWLSTQEGSTALTYAAIGGRLEVVTKLAELGGHLAADADNVSAVRHFGYRVHLYFLFRCWLLSLDSLLGWSDRFDDGSFPWSS